MGSTITLSDHLASALAHMNRVRELARTANLERHREAVVHEITQAELSISRVIGLIAGAPEVEE
jgi:hypothetical protein